MTHELKIKYDFVEPICKGEKTFEIREDDRGYQKGDTVKFRVVITADMMVKQNEFQKAYIRSIEESEYVITYVLSGWGLKNGFVVFGIRKKEL